MLAWGVAALMRAWSAELEDSGSLGLMASPERSCQTAVTVDGVTRRREMSTREASIRSECRKSWGASGGLVAGEVAKGRMGL